MAGPHEGQGCGDNGRGDYDTHHYVQVAHANASVVDCGELEIIQKGPLELKERKLTSDGERGHEQPETNNHGVGHVDELLSKSLRIKVGLVDIIGEDR